MERRIRAELVSEVDCVGMNTRWIRVDRDTRIPATFEIVWDEPEWHQCPKLAYQRARIVYDGDGGWQLQERKEGAWQWMLDVVGCPCCRDWVAPEGE